MKVAVLGLGYVGAVTAACLAKEGHAVVGIDTNKGKVDSILAGVSPIVEPGVEGLLVEGRQRGLLTATTDATAVRDCDVSILCVGTPSRANGDIDLTYLQSAVRDVGAALAGLSRPHVVVVRSTVPPGTIESAIAPVLEEASGRHRGWDLAIASCPEFLREATGVADFYNPPFTVVGTGQPWAATVVRSLLAFLSCPFYEVDVPTAEAIKYSCNAFHATKVAFANEIGTICQATGADSRKVMEIFCEDKQLNLSPYYLRPGFSFGGSCLPKDVRAITYRARSLDLDLPLLSNLLVSNEAHLTRTVRHVIDNGHRDVALLGLSFKPGTDDLRESPYVELAERLIGKGITLRIYDSNVNPERLIGANRAFIEERLPHLSRLLHANVSEALRDVSCAIVGSDEPVIAEALLLAPPPEIIDLSGRLGAPIEQLEGYSGVAW